MLTTKQIAAIITDAIVNDDGNTSPASIAAQKIHDLCKPDHTAAVAAAALENEVTSTLLNMLAATILATLIDEEGGGRTNITFSPGSMKDMMSNWDFTVEHVGLVRTVRITAKDHEEWRVTDTNEPLELRTQQVVSTAYTGPEDMPPQPTVHTPVEPHEYNRPHWCLHLLGDDYQGKPFMRCHDRADAERQLRSLKPEILGQVENRWCWHEDCPSSGCNHDPALRDPEVASDENTV